MTIHWLSQSAAAVSALAVGFVWYGVFFKNSWMQASGVTEEKIKNGVHPVLLYGLVLVLAFIISMGLYRHIIQIHAAFESHSENPFWHGVYHGLWDAFLYGGIPAVVIVSLFDQRNWKYIFINAGYWFLTFGVMGGMIGLLG